jgi:hypothetical protein
MAAHLVLMTHACSFVAVRGEVMMLKQANCQPTDCLVWD